MKPGALRILFVCSGNTCRSLLAEGLARRRFPDAARVESAGLRPQQAADAKAAIDTLRAHFNIDASGHTPRGLDAVNLQEFDVVVAMDPNVAAKIPSLQTGELVVWKVEDPWDEPIEYLDCARKINALISALRKALVSRHPDIQGGA